MAGKIKKSTFELSDLDPKIFMIANVLIFKKMFCSLHVATQTETQETGFSLSLLGTIFCSQV
jgi:hypothetical protein